MKTIIWWAYFRNASFLSEKNVVVSSHLSKVNVKSTHIHHKQHTITWPTQSHHRWKDIKLRNVFKTTPSGEESKIIYKQYNRPILTYAQTSWVPYWAKTHQENLRTPQKVTLHIATGCTQTTPTAHILNEIIVLSVGAAWIWREHTFMKYMQTLHYMQALHHTRRLGRITPANARHLDRHLSPSPQFTSRALVSRRLHFLLPIPRLETRRNSAS